MKVKTKERLTRWQINYELSKKLGFEQKDIQEIVTGFLEHCAEALKSGKELHFRNFGKFIIKYKPEKPVYNFYTKESFLVPEYYLCQFNPCNAIYRSVMNLEVDKRDRPDIRFVKRNGKKVKMIKNENHEYVIEQSKKV